MTRENEIQIAIDGWNQAALEEIRFGPEHGILCRRVVKSLELEMETGKPHCSCHLMPINK